MEQGQNDLAAALGGAPVQPAPPAPGPAAVSLHPSLAAGQAVVAETPQAGQVGAVQVPPQQAPQQPPVQQAQPVQTFPQAPVPQQAPVTQVAPNAPNAPTFINPDPSAAISEPQRFDPQTGQPIQVVAPANQPAQMSPQQQAQIEEQERLAQPPTIEELAACSNLLRSAGGECGGAKVASLLDRVTEARILEQQAQEQQERDQGQQFITH